MNIFNNFLFLFLFSLIKLCTHCRLRWLQINLAYIILLSKTKQWKCLFCDVIIQHDWSVYSIAHSVHFPSPISKSKHDNMCSVCVTCKKLQRQRARDKSASDRQRHEPISLGIPGSNTINTNTMSNRNRREACLTFRFSDCLLPSIFKEKQKIITITKELL